MNVATWLKDLGLERYATAFQSNAVDIELLPRLTAEDLKDLGVILVGDRRSLLDANADLGADGNATAAPPRLRSAPPAPTDGERRQVTVLFADLVGYTALSRDFDAEALHALTAPAVAAAGVRLNPRRAPTASWSVGSARHNQHPVPY